MDITVNFIAVKSSQIKEIGHNKELAHLYVRFHSGSLYKYFDIPHRTYIELITAESCGKYFNLNIKGIHNYEKVED